MRHSDRGLVAELSQEFHELGFEIVATRGTAEIIMEKNIPAKVVKKVAQGRPHVVDMIKNGEIDLVINTSEGRQSIIDSASIRRTALEEKVYCTTTIEGGRAVCSVIRNKDSWTVEKLQSLHDRLKI